MKSEEEEVVLTPKVTVLTGMPVGPPLPLSYAFCASETHSCLFCCPLQVLRYRARRPPSSVNTNTHIHTYMRTRPDTHLSKHGGWRDRGGWGLRGRGPEGFISRGMLPVSKDTHFTHGQKQMGASHAHSRHGTGDYIQAFFHSTSFTLVLSAVSISFLHPSIPLCVLLSTSFILSTFQVSLHQTPFVTQTSSLHSPVPSSPPRHARLCVSCMFSDSQTIIFFTDRPL